MEGFMNTERIRVGLVGCGAIGKAISLAIKSKFSDRAILYAISEPDKKKAQFIKRNFKYKLRELDIDRLIEKSDLVIEAANPAVARSLISKTLGQGKDIMVLSSGGVIKDYAKFLRLARKNRCRLYIASGALSGVDGLKAAGFGKITKVTLTSKKPIKALIDAPYIKIRNINLKKIKGECVIFEGPADSAIEGFPKNINVSATISLATLMNKKLVVKIVTSPHYRLNVHELEVEGDFGRIFSRVESKPSKDNPKTSQLAILSALATLSNILGYIKVGT
jgi:aspartate dehydrogenase